MTAEREQGVGPDVHDGAGSPNGAGPTAASATPAAKRPLDGLALAREVVLERLQNLLEWLLRRLKRYRAARGNWWEK